MRERFITTMKDKEYILKLRDPTNPFSSDPVEDISYSKDIGRLVTTEIDTPRIIFHYMKRSNRTVINTLKKKLFGNERLNAEASKIVKTVIPTTIV